MNLYNSGNQRIQKSNDSSLVVFNLSDPHSKSDNPSVIKQHLIQKTNNTFNAQQNNNKHFIISRDHLLNISCHNYDLLQV